MNNKSLTELLYPAHHATAPSTDEVTRGPIRGCAGGGLYTGHAGIQRGHKAGEAARCAGKAAARVTGRGQAALKEAAGACITLGGHEDREATCPAHTATGASGARGRGHT